MSPILEAPTNKKCQVKTSITPDHEFELGSEGIRESFNSDSMQIQGRLKADSRMIQNGGNRDSNNNRKKAKATQGASERTKSAAPRGARENPNQPMGPKNPNQLERPNKIQMGQGKIMQRGVDPALTKIMSESQLGRLCQFG